MNAPSRFVYEIPESVLELSPRTKEVVFGNSEPKTEDLNDFSSDGYSYDAYDDSSYSSEESFVGKEAYHPTYGKGTLISTEETFGVAKVVVDFDEFGLRKIRASQLKLL